MLLIKKFEGEKMIFLISCQEQRKYSRWRISSPRASRLTLGEEFFAESFFCSRRRNYSPSVLFFVENIIFYSRQRDLRRDHDIKLSPKNIALGEASFSRSAPTRYLIPRTNQFGGQEQRSIPSVYIHLNQFLTKIGKKNSYLFTSLLLENIITNSNLSSLLFSPN
jgi:hypothetical protein